MIKPAPSIVDASRKTMKDAAEAARSPLLSDKGQAVVPRIFAVIGRTAVNDDGQLCCLSQLHLPPENRLLNLAGRMVVKIVEADLSPGDDFWVPRPFEQLGISGVIGKACLVGMDADARPDFGILRVAAIFFRQPDAAVGGIGSFTIANCEIGFNARLFGAGQRLVAIGVVTFAFEMSVGIDEHACGETGASPVRDKFS